MRLTKQDRLILVWLLGLGLATGGSMRHAALSAAPFYPLNLAYLLLPDRGAALSVSILESLLWASGLYLLARVQGRGRFSAVLGATLGSAARQSLLLSSAAAPWLPWIAASWSLALQQRPLGGKPARLPWALGSAPLLAALFLGDERGTALATALALGVCALLQLRRDASAVALSGAALLLALGLSAPQVTVSIPLRLAPVPAPSLPWQALGHLLLLLAWLDARAQRHVPSELLALPLLLALLPLGVETRPWLLLVWSLGAARGAEVLQRLRHTHGPEAGESPAAPSGWRRWLLLGTGDVTAARLAALAVWGGVSLFPITGPAWLLAGIVLRVSRCPIYAPRRMGRRPVWELLALVVSALPLLAAWPTATQPADATLLKELLLSWWETPEARTSFFVVFLSAMSLVFGTVLWLWQRFYGIGEAQSDLQRVARNSTVPVVLNLFNRGMDFVYAALLLLRILGPANAGDYSTAIVIYTWLELVVNFGLDAVLMREVARTPQESTRYLYNAALARIGLWLIVLGPVLGIALLAPLPVQVRQALVVLYLGLLPATLCRNFDALFYAHELAAYSALVSSVATFIKVSLGALVLLSGRGIVYLAANALITNLIVLGILSALTRQHIAPLRRQPDGALRRQLLQSSWPLMLRDLLYTLYYRVDLVALQVLQGSLVAGWYSVSFKFLDTIAVIPQYFTLALFPILARQAFNDRKRFLDDYRLSVKLLLSLAFPIALLVSLYARELVLILGDEEYLPHSAYALRMVIWTVLLNWVNMLGQYVLIALRRQHTLSALLGLALALSVTGNALLIPRFSYGGAAALKLVLELAVWAGQALAIQRILGHVGWRALLGKLVLILAACGVTLGLSLPLGRGVALGLTLALYGALLWRAGYFSPQEWITLQRLLPQRRNRGVV